MISGLDNQCFLVTGGSGGLGTAICRAFAAAGADVAIHYHRGVDRANALAAELSDAATGREAATFGADLGDEAETERLFEELRAWRPRLDGIVANAGIWVADDVPLHRMELAQWNHTLRADLTSAFLTCRGYLRQLAAAPRDDASIVLIGSTAGLFGEENHADYAAAKAGLAHGLTSSLKNEIVRLAPRGRVNCVCPGWVLTPMAAAALDDPAALDAQTQTVALRKVAEPEDVASAVVFLSSARLAGHLSGTVLPVAGGMEGRVLHR